MISKAKRRTAERLKRRRHRKREGLALVEGPGVVLEALASPAEVRWVLVGEAYAGTETGWEIVRRGRERGADVQVVPDAEVLRLCETDAPRPVLAVAETPPPDPRPLAKGRYLVVDGVQTPGNLGTLLRSAWAFGLDGAALGEGTVDPWNGKSIRASAGAVFRFPLFGTPAGFPERPAPCGPAPGLYYADAGGMPVESVVREANPRQWRLVVGNELRGVSPRYREAGQGVAVPVAPEVDSLNVAVAGSVLMYALTRTPPASR